MTSDDALTDTPATVENAGPGWLLLIYRVPPEPTRLRSTVWRRIKSLGAIYLQNSVAALPASPANERSLRKLRREIVDMSGTAILLTAAALAGEAEVRGAFVTARNEEYAEIIDKAKVKNPPTTWQALLSSTWKGQVGMNDPSQSGPTFPLIAGVMNYLGGVSAGEKYFSTLKSNGLVIHPTNGPTLQALTSGQINLALVQSSAAIGATFTDKNIGIEYLNPATLLPSALGIDAKAPAAEQAEAEKFIEYVLSPAGQKVMQSGDPTGDSLYYPVIDGVSPLPSLPSLASVKTQTINPYTWGPQEATVNTWFDSNVVR